MPTYEFEAMDATGQEIKDVIDAATEEEAQTTIRQMGYFVTKIAVKKTGAQAGAAAKVKKKRPFAIGGGGTKHVCAFTRQLSILQDAGLPILRSLKILENNAKPGKLKNALMDVCDEIAPIVTVTVSPDQLWPVNHKYVEVIATVTVDDFDQNPTIELLFVESNEPDDGLGDGDTPNDIVILDDFTFDLRAERAGGEDDRIYTITYKVTDACGNETIAYAEVIVPHDMGN